MPVTAMGFIGGILLIGAIGAVQLLAGYGFAARLPRADAAERLAAAELGGLMVILLLLSVVNALQPLAAPWAWICLMPCLWPLAHPSLRSGLWRDLAAFGDECRWRTALVALASTAFLVALLAPLWFQPGLVYFDGTSNHDSYFWITGADYLRQHSYLTKPVIHPGVLLSPGLESFTGLLPIWGRMGGEGYIALVSALVGFDPIQIYIYASAALFLPWLAAVYLTVRTFVADRLNAPAAIALGLLQPIFLFFHGNANLPNLLGLLAGTLIIVSVARALVPAHSPRLTFGWLAQAALALHATLCTYPEILPFVLLPVALFWLEGWRHRPIPGLWGTPLALAAGLAINWVSTLRAASGFWYSLITAHANTQWEDLFRRLHPSEVIPSLATLNVYAGHWIGPWPAGLLSIVFVIAGYVVIRRARNPLGIGLAFSGPGLLLIYTAVTDFHYGMQKTVQFGGILIAAIFPIAAVLVLTRIASQVHIRRIQRIGAMGSLAAIGAFFAFAVGLGLARAYDFAATKGINRDDLALRKNPAPELHGGPVLVAANTFVADFFHGMWATYLMPQTDLLFSPQENHPGGYLEQKVETLSQEGATKPAAVYVSRSWADTIDSDASRLLTGTAFALVRRTNLLLQRNGFKPTTGVPRLAAPIVVFTMRPFQDCRMQLTLHPLSGQNLNGHVSVTRRTNGATWQTELSGPAPWQLSIPLSAKVDNAIAIRVIAPSLASDPYPLSVSDLRLTAEP